MRTMESNDMKNQTHSSVNDNRRVRPMVVAVALFLGVVCLYIAITVCYPDRLVGVPMDKIVEEKPVETKQTTNNVVVITGQGITVGFEN